MQTSHPQPVNDFTLDYTRRWAVGISMPCSAATSTILPTSACSLMASGPPLVERDFAPQILWHFEYGGTTGYRVAVPLYASSPPNPASRARTIAWARSITWSLVKMLET